MPTKRDLEYKIAELFEMANSLKAEVKRLRANTERIEKSRPRDVAELIDEDAVPRNLAEIPVPRGAKYKHLDRQGWISTQLIAENLDDSNLYRFLQDVIDDLKLYSTLRPAFKLYGVTTKVR